MASVINLAPSGALTQGQLLYSFDFGTGGIWDIAICKLNNVNVLFARFNAQGQTNGTFSPLVNTVLAGSGWLDDSSIKAYANALVPYSLPLTQVQGLAYVANPAVQTGLYTDAKGAILTAPVTVKSTTDIVKDILTGSSGASITGNNDYTAVPFYKKPLVWGIALVVIIGGWWYSKNN